MQILAIPAFFAAVRRDPEADDISRGGQKLEFAPGVLDGISDRDFVVIGKVIEDGDLAKAKQGDKALADVGFEAFAVHRAVEDLGSEESFGGRGGGESQGFIVSVGHMSDAAFSVRGLAVAAGELGVGIGFVDEN
jgi:hypothetical protein